MAGFENQVLLCKNINFDPASAKPHLGIINDGGKLPIGTGNTSPTPEILAGKIISPLGTLTIGYLSPNITVDLAGGGFAIETLTGDSGGPVSPASYNINLFGTANQITTTGTPATHQIEFSIPVVFIAPGSIKSTTTVEVGNGNLTVDAGDISLPNANAALTEGEIFWTDGTRIHNFGTSNVFYGNASGNGTLTVANATDNTGVGTNTLTALTTGAYNSAFGSNALPSVSTGTGNSAFGQFTLHNNTAGNFNSCFGQNAGLTVTGTGNSSLGYQSLFQLTTGGNNTCLGYQAGYNYTGAESNNICIGQGVNGTLADVNITRIGTGQSACFVSGIANVAVSNLNVVTIDTTTGQLGSMLPGSAFAYTNVTFAMSPYTVLATDYYLSVDSSGGSVVLNFPNAPTANQIWIIKDRTGNASANNISVTTPGGAVTIDGSTTYTISSNYGSIQLLANSTPTYEVF